MKKELIYYILFLGFVQGIVFFGLTVLAEIANKL